MAEKYTGAPTIDKIIERFKNNSSLKADLKSKLQQVTSKLYLDAQSAKTFCYRFQIPHRLPEQLLKTFGVSGNELRAAFAKVNMHTNRMFEDPYYQTLIVVYLIGLYTDDSELRKIAAFLMLVKLYNGMQYKYFKNGCKENVAEFIRRTKLTFKSLFKNKTPLDVIAYFIETLDNKYAPEIKKDPENMIVRLFAQAWGRLNAVFRNLAQLYYEYVGDENVDVAIQTLDTDEQGALKINEQLLQNVVDVIADKFEKAIAIKFPDLPISEKQFLMKRLTVTEKAIDMLVNCMQEHKENLKTQVSYLLLAIGIKGENDLHKLPILYTIDKLLAKKGSIHLNQYKKLVDEALVACFGESLINRISLTQKLKLRKLYSYILFYFLQKIISKMDKFERTLI